MCISYSMTSVNKSTSIAYFNVDDGVVTVYTVEGRFVTGPSINSICIYHSGPDYGNHFEFVQLYSVPKHPKNITNTDRSRFREFINLVGDELGHKRAFELYHNDAGDNFNTDVQVATTTGLLDSNDAIFPRAAVSKIGEFIQLVGDQFTALRARAIYTEAAGGDFDMAVHFFLTGKGDSVVEEWDTFCDLVSSGIESESLARNFYFDQAKCDYDAAVRIHLHNSNGSKRFNYKEQKQGRKVGKLEGIRECQDDWIIKCL